MKKRLWSVVLTLAMCMSLSVPAFATESEISESQIMAEIQKMEEVVWADLYRQLEMQDALGLIDLFKAELRPEIEARVMSKYGKESLSLATRATDMKYTFTNGGYVAYTSLNAYVLKTFYTPAQVDKYLKKDNTIGDIFEALLGEIPNIGTFFDAFFAAKAILDDMGMKEIEEAGGYGMTMQIRGGTEDATYIYGWFDYPYAYVYGDATIIETGKF